MSAWLGVVSRDHVRRGVENGIAQIGHGERTGLARMKRGDWLIYYSPSSSLENNEPLQSFTAIGVVADDEICQADEGGFKPWRRRVNYVTNATETPIRPLIGILVMTSTPNWGYQLRRGLLMLSDADFTIIQGAMNDR
ncbi:MAG: EVE domain-containing protein [Acidimicrobiaceae bacterium]|nr:EVE domain-containing protein [Acidimicrobiaceae bacterium]